VSDETEKPEGSPAPEPEEVGAEEELPVVGESEPWAEAEYLSELPDAVEGGEEFGEPEGEGPIVYRDGVFQIDPDYPSASTEVDLVLHELVESVLSPP